MEVYIRCETSTELLALETKAFAAFNGAAASTGCTVRISQEPTFLEMKHNSTLVDRYSVYMKDVGNVFQDPAEDAVASRGSTDMGNVSNVVPSIHPVFHVGCKEAYHTSEFAIQSATDDAISSALVVAECLAMVGFDVCTDAAFLDQVKRDFQADNNGNILK